MKRLVLVLISACAVALMVITHLPKQLGDYQPPVLEFRVEKNFAITICGQVFGLYPGLR